MRVITDMVNIVLVEVSPEERLALLEGRQLISGDGHHYNWQGYCPNDPRCVPFFKDGKHEAITTDCNIWIKRGRKKLQLRFSDE
jgi:hypothetical protein